MDRISELRRRERRLLDKVRRPPARESGAASNDRTWIVHHLSEMSMILERHLAEVVPSVRQTEEYRLEIELPLFHYLSRAYEFFDPETSELVL